MNHPIALIVALVVAFPFIGGGIVTRLFPGFAGPDYPPRDRSPQGVEAHRKQFEARKVELAGKGIRFGLLVVAIGLVIAFV